MMSSSRASAKPSCSGATGRRSDDRREEIPHVAFAGAETSVYELGLEAARRKTIRQGDGLDRRAADVQSRDDAEDANRAGWFHSRVAAHCIKDAR
jgi:hypothetical protein